MKAADLSFVRMTTRIFKPFSTYMHTIHASVMPEKAKLVELGPKDFRILHRQPSTVSQVRLCDKAER
jgi:hypothetical protein